MLNPGILQRNKNFSHFFHTYLNAHILEYLPFLSAAVILVVSLLLRTVKTKYHTAKGILKYVKLQIMDLPKFIAQWVLSDLRLNQIFLMRNLRWI
jgi:hypothetical protein